MKQTEINRLNNNWAFAQKLWVVKKEQYNLKKWSLICDNSTDRIGVCNYSNKVIILSTVFMRGASCNYVKVKKALMHEIAHALTPGHSHDKIWKTLCEGIGGDTRLAGTMDLPGMSWSVYCPGCKRRYEYSTKPNFGNVVCSVCHQKPIVKYIK